MLQKEYVKKTFRVETDIIEKFMELKNSYGVFSDNQLFSVIIKDIYQIKKTKALIPFEEFEKRDLKLQQAILEVGKLQGILSEKEKNIGELKEQLRQVENKKEEQQKPKSFWARLFGTRG